MRWIRRRLTYANVAASAAFFLALGGGAYAVAAPSFVGDHGSVSVCVQPNQEMSAAVAGTDCPAGWVPLAVNQKGQRGKRGRRGRTGRKGDTGTTGLQGLTGATGAIGATGLIGPQGPKGATGASGPQGPAGPQGNTGATGATGRGAAWPSRSGDWGG